MVAERWDEAIAGIYEARKYDPIRYQDTFYLGYTFMLARRYDEALKETDRIQKIIPDNKNILFIPWIAYLLKGEYKKMADISQKMMTASSTIITKNSIIGSEHAVLGNHDEAIKQLRILEEDYNSHFAGENSIALLKMLLGDFDKTFKWRTMPVHHG